MFSGRQDCFFNSIEFRISNCNNKSLRSELNIPERYKSLIALFAYVISIIIIVYRIYNIYIVKKLK